MSWFAAARWLRERADQIRRRGGPATDEQLAEVKRYLHGAPSAFGAWVCRRIAQELDEVANILATRARDDDTPPPGRAQ